MTARRAEQLWWLASLTLVGLIAGQMFIPALGATLWRITQW